MANILRPHQKLAGYEILELVGKGGMGEVYRARQISMDRTVALKVLAPRLVAKDPSFAERFVAEARAAGKLQNPNIINVHDVGKAEVVGIGELSYFSMEFVEGQSVKELMAKEHPCSEANVALVMHGMVEALAYAEKQGIVHRDIKPDNIMITATRLVKLADLGLALNLAEEAEQRDPGKPKSNLVMGTPLYMSPEQARAAAVDPRSDQYSLGATLFHMLTGEVPYKGTGDQKSIMKAHVLDPVPDPHDINPEVPETWRQICMKLMAKDPAERFADVAALRDAVQAALRGVTLDQMDRRGVPGGRRRAGAAWTVFAVPAGVLAVAGVAAWMYLPHGDSGGGPTPNQQPLPPPPPNPQQPTPGQTAGPPDLAKLEALIAALPDDPDKAQSALDRLAADPAWKAPEAAAMIADAAATRRKAADARQRAALDADLAPLKAKLAAKDVAGAKDALAAFARNHPDDTTDIKAEQKAIQDALKDLATGFRQRLDTAQSSGDVDAALKDIHASALSADDITPLDTLAGQRRAQLAAADQAKAQDATAKAWASLAAALDQQRRTLKYADLAELVDNAQPSFPDGGDDRALAKALDQLGDKAASGESTLKAWVRMNRPNEDVRVDGKVQKMQIKAIGLADVTVVGSDGNERKLDRGEAGVPWRDLLDQALANSKDPDNPKIRAACLWMWKAPEARAAFQALGDDPLGKALARVDSVLHGGLELNAEVDRHGDTISVLYDFSGKEQLADFAGDGLAWGAHGLAWDTKVTVTKGDRQEAGLPKVQWRARLAPPLSVKAQAWIHPKSSLVLLGVEAGGHAVRLGCSNLRQPALGVLVTNPDGTDYDAVKLDETVTLEPTDPVDIGFEVGADGKVVVSWDLAPLDVPKLTLALPPGAPVTVILEAYQFGNAETAVDVSRLEISGQVAKQPGK
jgi:serine/threonine-protein kinase